MLHRVVDELVLRLRLHHPGALRANHLYGALDVDLGVEACMTIKQYNSVEYDKYLMRNNKEARQRETKQLVYPSCISKGYTNYVQQCVTGRSRCDKPHKVYIVYIFLLSITSSSEVFTEVFIVLLQSWFV